LIDGHYGVSSTFTAAMKKDGGSGRIDGTGAYTKRHLVLDHTKEQYTQLRVVQDKYQAAH